MGPRRGAGTELALACRHVVATPAASFALPEVGLGIYPGFGGTQRAPRKLGVGIAKWMIFTGKTLSANDACRAGLVDEVVPSDRLDEVSRALALGQYACQPRPAKTAEMMAIEQFFAHARAEDLRQGTADTGGTPALERAMRLVASKPSTALSMAEQIIDQGLGCDLSDALRLEIIHLTEIFQTSEARLGLQSRAGKRLG